MHTTSQHIIDILENTCDAKLDTKYPQSFEHNLFSSPGRTD